MRTRFPHIVLPLLVVAAALTVLPGCSYNTLTAQEEQIKSAWSEVQNQLQRRNDLIPNLVETVRGVAGQEQQVFTQIAESRAKLAGAKTPAETMAAANEQSSALARLLVVVENYPQLKSNESFNRLMDELSGTENRLTVSRKRYNDSIQAFNTLRKQFPALITAKMFGFSTEYPYFEAPKEATQVPKVDFGGFQPK
jgi:LemA protein